MITKVQKCTFYSTQS